MIIFFVTAVKKNKQRCFDSSHVCLAQKKNQEEYYRGNYGKNRKFKVIIIKLFISDNVGPRSLGIDLSVNTLKQVRLT